MTGLKNGIYNILQHTPCRNFRLLLILAMISMAGCATPNRNPDENKQLLDQALVLQEISPQRNASGQASGVNKANPEHGEQNSVRRDSREPLQWQFSKSTLTPSQQQIQQLYNWLAAVKQLQQAQLVLESGPDWLSSHKRGKAIRQYIPRGLKIRQQYQANMKPHLVTLTLISPELSKPVSSSNSVTTQTAIKQTPVKHSSLKQTSNVRIKNKTGAAWLEAIMREASQ